MLSQLTVGGFNQEKKLPISRFQTQFLGPHLCWQLLTRQFVMNPAVATMTDLNLSFAS
jgi:hypothetical protein